MKPYRRVAPWMIILGLAALVWAAPVGLLQFGLTSLPTQVYYAVLTLGGIALVLAGASLFFGHRFEPAISLAAGVGALALSINQITGLAFNTILCFSPG
jgi:multidrug transporter EmrE-like cation transporter